MQGVRMPRGFSQVEARHRASLAAIEVAEALDSDSCVFLLTQARKKCHARRQQIKGVVGNVVDAEHDERLLAQTKRLSTFIQDASPYNNHTGHSLRVAGVRGGQRGSE